MPDLDSTKNLIGFGTRTFRETESVYGELDKRKPSSSAEFSSEEHSEPRYRITPAKRRVIYGRENPLVHFLLAIGAGVIFTYGITDDLFHQWRQRENLKKKAETGNHSAVRPEPVQPTVGGKNVVRGYDSRELFWEDALLRIDELKRQIAADLKKED